MLSRAELEVAERHLTTLQSGGYFFLTTQLYYGIHGKKYPACEVANLRYYLNKIMVLDYREARDYFYNIVDQMTLIVKDEDKEEK